MKKLVVGILSLGVILGAGTFTYAQGNGEGLLNFGQMKPYMEEMHPDLSTKELKEMFNSCHGSGGMMENTNADSMMNNL
ncbi:hypothetical protein [Litchfieldia salsa]|uniref:FAD/FMN-containing dehydrogenase n=1 Tax=Litchfieldia salsa TaxID=930152 RepID=A0A1H0WAR8_9BACI|nr:hypothetical protein [Litchfieldia salsa]SDP87869.1 hypothetical protein SAMN05216565_11048 [Litchfieldia salsa]